MSEYTGCEIAERRCKIKILQHIKNNQIIPQIQAYEHLISTMLNSKQLNPQSYEFKRIKAEYDNLLNQYTAIKNKIKYSQSKLREYIADKESVNKLIENLNLSRIAKSDDINTLKKIIFRLFENLKNSTIYKNQDYINEFGDNTIAGLVNNWNEEEDGKMTFTLLLNKTFETIITNLNNLNQNRINID